MVSKPISASRVRATSWKCNEIAIGPGALTGGFFCFLFCFVLFCFVFFFEILASNYGLRPYGRGPLGPYGPGLYNLE